MEKVLITGLSGSGKSFSLRRLPAESTFFIRGTSKMPIAIKGINKMYAPLSRDLKEGNMITITNPFRTDSQTGEYVSRMNDIFNIAIKRGFKTIVIDDMQYILLTIENIFKSTGEFKDQRRIYALIKQFTYGAFTLADTIMEQHGIQTIFIWQKQDAKNQLVIPGEAFNEVIVPQGFFNIVLEAESTLSGDRIFKTNGYGLCKSPFEMFQEDTIPNDIMYVNEQIKKFYE